MWLLVDVYGWSPASVLKSTAVFMYASANILLIWKTDTTFAGLLFVHFSTAWVVLAQWVYNGNVERM